MSEHVYDAEEVFERHATTNERWSVHPLMEELKKKAKAKGLWNLWLPLDSAALIKITNARGNDEALYKGPGLTNLEYAHLAREMGKVPWASEIFNCSAPDTGNMEVLLRYGTKEQQERWLLPLLMGDIRSCFAMTEPAVASSDATNIESSIAKSTNGTQYVVNGRKWWTSGACDPRCAIAIFMGKTKTTGPQHEQQSMVLVPMLNNHKVKVVRPLLVFGYDDAPHGHAEVIFDNVVVDVKESLLAREGAGFAIAQGRLGPGRLHHCMRLVGMAERSLDVTYARVKSRVAFGKPLSENSNVLNVLGNCRVEVDGARLLTLYAAHVLDQLGIKDSRARSAVAACKISAPNVACSVIDRCIQLFGGEGVSQDSPLARLYAGARTLRIADGPDEVHLETVAKIDLRRSKL
jgi:alkylation response protein AidB-like acyl-CoA dehydrogenase